jgi:hypothetical protein
MRTRVSTILLTLVLVAVLLALTPLAHAGPPDLTWISGIWDDGDFDDVVVYITSAAGSLPPSPPVSYPSGRPSRSSEHFRIPGSSFRATLSLQSSGSPPFRPASSA